MPAPGEADGNLKNKVLMNKQDYFNEFRDGKRELFFIV